MTNNLFRKYKMLIFYGLFGVLTTVINIATYQVCYKVAGFSNIVSNISAWIVAVLFAFVTNKTWVFEDYEWSPKSTMKKIMEFGSARIATGLIDLGIMYLFVDVLERNSLMVKIVSNIIVIVLNFLFSKLIFKNKHSSSDRNAER